MPLTRKWLVACVANAFLVAVIPTAFAQSPAVAACVEAHEAGQELRQQKRLLEARERLRSCAQSECPAVVVQQCAQWLEEIDKEIPTVVLVVQDASGVDRTDVDVRLDGVVLARGWAGTAREVNPGEHTVTVAARGEVATSAPFVAREGEKRRIVVVRTSGSRRAAASTQTAAEALQPSGSMRTVGLVVSGVGLAAVGVFAVLAVSAKRDFDELQRTCGPGCTEGEVEPARRKALVADIALGAGVLSLGVGGYLVIRGWPRGASSPNGVVVGAQGLF